MNTNTNNTTKKATRPEGFTKAAWETDTFRVYQGLVKLVKGEILAPAFINHPVVKSLMERCCNAKTPEDRWGLFVNLVVSMNNYGTADHVKVNKVKSISTLRQWFNGQWAEKATRPVVYKEPKDPTKKADKKPAKKVKNVSVSEWIKGLTDDQLDQLKVEIAMRDIAAA